MGGVSKTKTMKCKYINCDRKATDNGYCAECNEERENQWARIKFEEQNDEYDNPTEIEED